MIVSGDVREHQVQQYLRENDHLLRITRLRDPATSTSTHFAVAQLGGGDVGEVAAGMLGEDGADDCEDDDDEDESEVEMSATLLQLMRDNARLEALNTSYIEKIIAERDSCAHLKVRNQESICSQVELTLPNIIIKPAISRSISETPCTLSILSG